MLIVKPTHTKYALSYANQTQYCGYALQYSRAKKYGIRGVYAWASGVGLLGVVKDAAKGTVVQYGKRKFAAVCINFCTLTITTAVAVFTNATKIVKWAGRIHAVSAFTFECVEDSSNLVFLPVDLAVFGQPIPVGEENRFNLFGNSTDFLD